MYIFKSTNPFNAKIYIGQSSFTPEKSKSYKGSGIKIKRAFKKYGEENFIKEILMNNITDKGLLDLFEKYFIAKFNSTDKKIGYNIAPGGGGTIGMISAIDKEGNNVCVPKDDPGIISGNLVGVCKGYCTFKDINGVHYFTATDDPKVTSGELVGVRTGWKWSEKTCEKMRQSKIGDKHHNYISSSDKTIIADKIWNLRWEYDISYVDIGKMFNIYAYYYLPYLSKELDIIYQDIRSSRFLSLSDKICIAEKVWNLHYEYDISYYDLGKLFHIDPYAYIKFLPEESKVV